MLNLRTVYANIFNQEHYDARMRSLNQLTWKQRKIITQIITTIKISKGIYQSSLTRQVNNCLYVNTRNIRNPPEFNPSCNSVAKNGPLFKGTTAVNAYRRVFDRDDSIKRIKLAMKTYLIQNQN